MFKWLGAIGGWQGYVAAAVLSAALSIGATYYIVSMPYKLMIAKMERDTANQKAADVSASLGKLQGFIANMNTAATDYGKTQDALFASLDKIRADFDKASRLKPLPPDCRPDADRMHSLSTAIDAANAAASRSGLSEILRTTH